MTESARTPLPGATNGCSCCAPAADATAPAGHQSADPTGTSAGDATYQVEGMTCGHCKSSVEEEIGEVAGVTMVEATVDTGQVTVTGENFTDDDVVAAVTTAGYTVKP